MTAPQPRRRLHRRPVPASKPPVVPIAIGAGVVVLVAVVFLLMRDRSPDSPERTTPPPADVAASGSAGTGADASESPIPPAAAPDPGPAAASPAVESSAPPPAAVAAPPPKPAVLPTARSLRKRLETAASATEAAAVARDAEKLADAALTEECWTRVFELDREHEEARERLDVRVLFPAQDLPGFAAIRATPQRVHLQPFEEAARKEMTRAERTAFLASWDAGRAAIEARIEKARTQPYWREVDELRVELQGKKFFDELQYEVVEAPPYVLFVEVEGTPERRQQRREEAEKGYTPFLEAYDRKIRLYLFPLAPKPPEQDPLFPVFVFLSFERYRDYCVADRGDPPTGGRRAHYEPWKKQSFTYSPVLKVGLGAFQEGVQSLLHELTHAWVDQLASDDGGETRAVGQLSSHWFSEGIAEYMSCQFLHQGQVVFQPWRSQRVAGAYRPPGWRIPLREALTIRLHALDGWAEAQVSKLPQDKREAAVATISSGFYADMSNFILWLNLRSGANRSAQFEAYAREELAGRGGFDTFERCVPGLLEEVADLDATIDDFVKRIANGKINPYKEFAEAQKATAPAAPANAEK